MILEGSSPFRMLKQMAQCWFGDIYHELVLLVDAEPFHGQHHR